MKYGVIKQGSQLKFVLVKRLVDISWKELLKRQDLKVKPDLKIKRGKVYLTYRLEHYYFHDYLFEKDGVDYDLLML